jgi:hypothetical protein
LSAKAARDSISLPDSDGDKKPGAPNESKQPAAPAAAPDASSVKDTTGEREATLPSAAAASASVTDTASLNSNSFLKSSPVEKIGGPKQVSASLNIADQITVLSSLQGDLKAAASASALAFAQAQASSSLTSSSERSSASAEGLMSQDQIISSLLMQQGASSSNLPPSILSQVLSRENNAIANQPSNLLQSYDQLLALRLHEQKSQDQLAFIRALQQQEEVRLRREIEYHSQRALPCFNNPLETAVRMLPWSVTSNAGTLSSNVSNNNPLGSIHSSLLSAYPVLGSGTASQRPISLDVVQEILKLQQNKNTNTDTQKK